MTLLYMTILFEHCSSYEIEFPLVAIFKPEDNWKHFISLLRFITSSILLGFLDLQSSEFLFSQKKKRVSSANCWENTLQLPFKTNFCFGKTTSSLSLYPAEFSDLRSLSWTLKTGSTCRNPHSTGNCLVYALENANLMQLCP